VRKTWLVWSAATVVGLSAVVWFGGPPLVKSRGEAALTQALGRPVTLGHVTVQPFALKLTVDDITIAAPAGNTPLLAVERVVANVSSSSLFRLAPVIETLEVIRPKLRIAHLAPGHYDIDDLIARFTPAPDAKPSDPARFALYNVQVVDGEVHFDDRPAARQHEVTGLHLSLPFLSNLATHVAVKVAPRLAFKLNGAAFDTGALTTPFAATRAGTLNLAIDHFDVTPYLGYAPKVWPVRLQRGIVDSNIEATFSIAPTGTPTLALTGKVEVADLAVTTSDGTDLLAWKSLAVGLRDVQPLARTLAFSQVALDGVTLHVRRRADGRFDGVPPATEAQAAAPTPALAASAAASATATLGAASPPGWQVAVDAFTLDHGQVMWSDATVSPPAAMSLLDVTAKADHFGFPATTATGTPLSLSASLNSTGDKPRAWGTVAASGSASPQHADVKVTLDGVSLEAIAPYLDGVLLPRLAGRFSGAGRVDWSAAADTPRLQLTLEQATLDDLRLTEPSDKVSRRAASDVLLLKQLLVADMSVDVPARQVTAGEVRVQQPSLLMERGEAGTWNVQRWIRAAAAPVSAAVPASSPPVSQPETAPWKVVLQSAKVEGGRLRVADASPATGGAPIRTEVTGLALDVRHLVWEGDRPAAPAKVKLGARLGNGQVAFDGQVGLVPQQASGALSVTRLPVQAFAPYVTLAPGVALARAEAGFKGNVLVRVPAGGVEATVKGDVLLSDVLLQSRSADATAGPGDDLLQWQALALQGLQYDMKPNSKPRLAIADATLNDLRARLVVTEQGRLNLQDAAGGRVGPQTAAAPADTASAASSAPGAAGTTARTSDELPIDATVGQTRITNGRIEFSDNFVRPRYSADLTQLNGRLGTISTQGTRMADLELKGRAAGTADLEISGQVNPLAHPLTLDIKARASDLELAPLSPYAAKYVGYAIERGKLTMDVAYRIDPDGRLEARNQVIVNQLTFGEAVPSPQATSLPVRLAVSLLKDRHGVIDINLPISGSLNDPEFSIGGLIFKVLGNLIAKAVTSPFSLLSGGGQGDSSQLAFVPGTVRLTPDGVQSLDRVATALTEKPALKLTITGTSDADAEREAFQRQALSARLVAERRKEVLATGGNAEAAATLGEADRARLLKLLYRQTEMADKPRNALGLVKDLPADEMEALLKAHIAADGDAMRELALQRAVAVRDALVGKGLPSERLFLAAPKGKGDNSAWAPSVTLGLTLD
jgi:hypothetical protein